MLGVCLGHQAIAEAFGGIVIQSGKPVHGKVSKIYHKNTKLFRNINNPFNATRYHSLIVKKNSIPKNFSITATIEDGTVMAIEHLPRFLFLGFNFTQKALPQILDISY